MGKQAAAHIIHTSPYPLRTLRDGLLNGGRDASAIRVPLAHVIPTKAEIAKRITQEAKSETPSSAMPVTLNQAIELLKAAEEGWQGGDDEYAELVADAQRLKAIRAVAKRRPIRDDEQALINELADKYSGAIETAVSDSSRRQQALIAKQADTSAQGVADAAQMRDDIAARFAPHDRAKSAAAKQQAAAIDRLLGPRFEALQGGDPNLPPGDPGRPQSLTSIRKATKKSYRKIVDAISEMRGGTLLNPTSLGDITEAIIALQGSPAAPSNLADIKTALAALPQGADMADIKTALAALPQRADMAATFAPLQLQNAQMLSEMTTRGTDTLTALKELRGDLELVKVQGRGDKGQFIKPTTLLPSSGDVTSSSSPPQVSIRTPSQTTLASSLPDEYIQNLIDASNVGGVIPSNS
jgi:hypothetical protein